LNILSNDSGQALSLREEEPAIWFHLIEAQFSATGIKPQNLKYANALANLPKHVLQAILDTVDAGNKSVQPFDDVKIVLLGQFGKSKWQSYFELLRLSLDMQGLKPSILTGKLNQSLSHGVSPDNNLLLAMFLIRLLPSMGEVVVSGNHQMASAWLEPRKPCGMLAAATTPRSWLPQLTAIGAWLLLREVG
jgi:hypothetical protein